MANVYATKTGNWSDVSVWNTGALPATTDDVYANNFTITIDQDISVHSLNTGSATGITAGGGFTVASVASGVTRNIAISTTLGRGSGGNVVQIPSTSGIVNMSGVNVTGTLVNLNGNVATVQISASPGTVNIGNIDGNNITTDGANGAVQILNGTVNAGTVKGAHTGGGGPAVGVLISGGSLTCGNVNGGDVGSNAHGITVTGGCVINCGTVTAGSAPTSQGIYINTSGTVTINSNSAVAQSSGNGIYANNQCTATTISVNGPVTASSNAHGIRCDALANVRAKGPMTQGPNNYVPIYAETFMVYNNQVAQWTVKDDSAFPNPGNSVIMSSANSSVVPNTADVRKGVSYGSSLVGTLNVPAPSSVAAGVPTDNTTGTAALDINQVSSVLGAQIAAALTS